MPRLPSEESGPPLYWRLMRACCRHFGFFTSAAIRDMVGNRDRHTIQFYIDFLRGEGIVRIVGEERQGAMIVHRYALTRDGEAPPARRAAGSGMGTRQQALWIAMRSLGAFSPAELALVASTEQQRILPDTARPFIFDLKAAGYVAPVGEGKYRLLPARNTGPRAPIVLRGRGVFDLNLMRIVNVNEPSGLAPSGRLA